MKNKIIVERRFFKGAELRATGDGDGPKKLEGYAAVFNQRSENLNGFREVISPGAFTTAIAEDDVRALWNHNPDFVLGRNRSKTLDLAEDDHGLKMVNTPPDTQWARDLEVSIERGDVNQMSFAFSVRAGGEQWHEDEEGVVIRTITDAKLYDVSPVTYPAYTQTDVSARSVEWATEQGLLKRGQSSGAEGGQSPDTVPVSVLSRQLKLKERSL